MERVKKGEKYWYIYDRFETSFSIEDNSPISNKHFETKNYFTTKEQAEAMAAKIRAVLKGADVIEMPSEEEIEDAMKESITESILSVAPYGGFTSRATDLLECAWMKSIEWLKSKIVK